MSKVNTYKFVKVKGKSKMFKNLHFLKYFLKICGLILNEENWIKLPWNVKEFKLAQLLDECYLLSLTFPSGCLQYLLLITKHVVGLESSSIYIYVHIC